MRLLLLLLTLALQTFPVLCEEPTTTSLYRELSVADSLLFSVGFNTCSLDQFDRILSEDFEFIHDEVGITDSKSTFINNIRTQVCDAEHQVIRRRIHGSLEVYPLYNNGLLYGALQTGRHEFYRVASDTTEDLTSVARFTHVWIRESGAWRLRRGLSYDHHNSQQSKPSADTVESSNIFLDRAQTEQWLKENRIPAVGIGTIADGNIQSISVYGVLENGKIAPQNTIWNVASLTKPVTALVVLKLINAGMWSLDEPLHSYWIDPDVAHDPRAKRITTRHILSHQSGLPNWRTTHPEKKLSFVSTPGTQHQYSGEGFEYLRKAIERKFKRPFHELADSLVFEPLNMRDTRYFWDSTVDESRFAKWHNANGGQHTTYRNRSANAADDLLTTVEDYCKFLVHILHGAGLSHELYQEMDSNQIRIHNTKYWGLGWWVDENVVPGIHAILHGGDDVGVHTIAIMIPSTQQGLVIFTNSDNGTDIYVPAVLAHLKNIGQGIIDIETK